MVGLLTTAVIALLKARAAIDAQAELYAVRASETRAPVAAPNPIVVARTAPQVTVAEPPETRAAIDPPNPAAVERVAPKVAITEPPDTRAARVPANPAAVEIAPPKAAIAEPPTGSISTPPAEVAMTGPHELRDVDEPPVETSGADAGKGEIARDMVRDMTREMVREAAREDARLATVTIHRGRGAPSVYLVPRE